MHCRITHITPRRMIFTFACIGVTIILYNCSIQNFSSTSLRNKIFTPPEYFVYTPGCYIPKINPMDPTIAKYVSQLTSLNCNFGDKLVVVEGDVLSINRTAVRLGGGGISYCNYSTIYRKNVGSDDKPLFKLPISFTNKVVLREGDDLLYVQCYNGNILTHTSYLMTIIPKKKVKERCARNKKRFEESIQRRDRFDVVLLGVDSVSRSSSVRHMPATRKILLQELGAVELKGYHKVGDNTFPNAVALMTGKTETEFFNGSEANNYLVNRDDMIWDKYLQSGYVTIHAEDRPAIFNYRMRGFYRTPTDYYMHQFSLTTQKSVVPEPTCTDGVLYTHRVLEWTNRFTETFSDDQHFSFSYICGLTHDYLNQMSLIDLPISQFVRRLRDSGAFKRRTILIIFADHGMRFGKIRNTYVGGMEDRLPMMYMVFPEWFHERYPTQWRHLQVNAARLTTPFDIHATLLHALTAFDPENAPNTPHGYSLLHEDVPPSRTCELASIPTGWCACHSQKVVAHNDSVIKGAAKATVQWLNKQLFAYADRCALLKLNTITRGAYINPNIELRVKKELSPQKSLYMVNLRTEPGGGEFESTVEFSNASHTYHVFPEISRVNAYGNSSSCIQDLELRKYCYCKRNIRGVINV